MSAYLTTYRPTASATRRAVPNADPKESLRFPSEIHVHASGLAVVRFPSGHVVHFLALADVLEEFGLTTSDLDVID